MLLENWQSEFAEALMNDETECLSITPSEHFIIYSDHYFSTLTEALYNVYPKILQLISHERFNEVAKGYIMQYPSMSPNLNEYGAYFDQFLIGIDEIKSFAHLPELARFEWGHHCRRVGMDASAG